VSKTPLLPIIEGMRVKIVDTQQFATVERVQQVPETGNTVYWVKTAKGFVKCMFRDEIEAGRWPKPNPNPEIA